LLRQAVETDRANSTSVQEDNMGNPVRRSGEMVAIKLYDIETGHVETLVRVSCQEVAQEWLRNFRTGGLGTNDVVYTEPVER
jgi:hypothetical protein